MTRFVVLVAHGGTEERLRAFAASTISEVLTMSVFVRSRLTRLNRFTTHQQANAFTLGGHYRSNLPRRLN